MRNKWILSILMTILALPFLSSVGFAEETDTFKDGTYAIDYTVWHATDNEESSANGFFIKPALLTVENGKQSIQFGIKSSDMLLSLKANGNDVVVVSENEEENQRVVEFEVEGNLSEPVIMEMSMSYGGNHTTRTFFDVSNVTVKEIEEKEEPVAPEEPSEPTEPEQPIEDDSDNVENINPALAPDEAYTINYVSSSNSVNRQFENPAVLLYKDGKKYIQINGSGGQFIKSLTINGKEVTWGEKNADGTFIFQIEVKESLSEELDFGMVIDARGTEMTHSVDLSFDESTQTDADISNYTLLALNNDSEEDGKDEVPSKGDDPVADEDSANKDNEDKTPAKKNPLTPEKAYEIDFVIKHETDDKPSAANSFFKGPAILLEKDGERYVQITVTGSEFINSLKTKHGDVVVVKVNDDGSMVVQFKVDGKISDVIELDMTITVPGVYENQEHKARLFLTESSMEEIDVSDYLLVASNNGNGPKVDGEPVKNKPLPGATDKTPKADNTKTNNDPTIEKPDLGSNGKNGSTNETKIAGQEKNPQTGDTTNILLYVLLLIGSAIPLAVMAKRRFANAA